MPGCLLCFKRGSGFPCLSGFVESVSIRCASLEMMSRIFLMQVESCSVAGRIANSFSPWAQLADPVSYMLCLRYIGILWKSKKRPFGITHAHWVLFLLSWYLWLGRVFCFYPLTVHLNIVALDSDVKAGNNNPWHWGSEICPRGTAHRASHDQENLFIFWAKTPTGCTCSASFPAVQD